MKRFFIGAILLALSISPSLGSVSRADSATSWTDTAEPQLEEIKTLAPNELVPYSISGNRDCETRKVVTRPSRIPPFWPFVQSEHSHESCVVSAGFGAVSSSGYLQMTGTNVFGSVKNSSGGSLILIAPPRSPHAIYIVSVFGGVRVYLVRNFADTVQATTNTFGEVEYKLKADTPVIELADKNGNALIVRTDSLSFSSNGQWMVVDAPFIGALRVNMETFEALPFDMPFNYNIGIAPSVQSAITNDGRFAVVASSRFTRFKLFDLASCAPAPTTITEPVSCQYRDVYSFLNNKLNGFAGASTIRFTSNYSFYFYAQHKDANGITKRSQFLLTAPGETAMSSGYLALGDSFASGEGAYQYKALTDTKDNNCHLSLRSYPYLLATDLGLNTTESVACSGAIIEDIISSSLRYGGQVKQKIPKEDRNNLSQILTSFLPGYLPQNDFLEAHKPGIITVSAAGNDIGFADKIKRCMEPDTCYASYEDRLEIVKEANAQFYKLTDLYTELQRQSHPQTKIYIIGYPQLVKPGGNCGVNVHLNATEIEFASNLVTHLNKVIKAAADKTGVYYVDVENALTGHRLCEASYSNIAVNGLTAGNDKFNIPLTDRDGPVGNESFHPNAMGHRLLKEAVLEKTSNLTAPMPQPNPSATIPDEAASPVIGDALPSGRQLYAVNYDSDATNNMVTRGLAWGVVVDRVDHKLKPLSSVLAVLKSDPVDLGTFSTDASGEAAFDITIPEDTPVGFHTLILYGTSIAGEPVAIYKVLYVAASESDYDGNGILNEDEACLVVEAVGLDHDRDGLDDACDGLVTDPPPEASSPDEKPAANNTETVAGNEPLVARSYPAVLSAAHSLPPDSLDKNPFSYFLSDSSSSSPQVAGKNSFRAPGDATTVPLEIKNDRGQSRLALFVVGPALGISFFLVRRRLFG